MTTTIPVRSAQPYDVVMDRGVAPAVAAFDTALSGAHSLLVIHQPPLADRAAALAAALRDTGRTVDTLELADAEAGKTVSQAERCWDVCAEVGLTRHDAIVSLGGGAATDMAGFIAATWMRGIRVVHYPTTLLAMVDAAVGGKTGMNTAAGKNLVGSFHEPSLVYIDLEVLETLPREELIAGSAEIVKAGFIADTAILDLYEADPVAALDPAGSLPELIERAVAVKAQVVAADLKESHLREILNYGHTYGHAVEHRENYQWRHGDAVAVGMVFEAELAREAGLLSAEDVARHRQILSSIGLPTSYDGAPLSELIEVMTLDKKNKDGNIRFVVLDDIGSPTRLQGPDYDLLAAAYAATQTPEGRAAEGGSND